MKYRHRKTGGIYEVLYDGCIEADLQPVVIYRNVDPTHDQRVWVRPYTQFHDGRFEPWFEGNLGLQEVFEKIREERNYQDNKWGTLAEKPQSIPGWLLILRKELEEAEAGWMKNVRGRDSALGEIVQIAAVAVAALQQHGFEGN